MSPGAKALFLTAAAAAIFALAWQPWPRDTAPAAKKAPLPAHAVLSIDPKAGAPVAPNAAAARRLHPDLEQLQEGRDLAGLYERVRLAQTPDAQLIRAEIYYRCASRGQGARAGPAQRREKFVAGLLSTDPAAKDRIAAFDRLNVDACKGLEHLGQFSQESLRQALAAAKEAGNARAAAWLLAQDIESRYHAAQREANPASRPRGIVVSDEQFGAALRLLETGDPEVVRELQDVLSSSIDQGALLIDGRPLDPRAMHSALALLACDLGANCGTSSPEVLSMCAHRGECGTSTLQDHTFFYVASPAQAQQIDLYRQALLAMLDRRDFSRLTLARDVPGTSVFIFSGRRRPLG